MSHAWESSATREWPEYVPRECDCSHTEALHNLDGCNGSRYLYIPATARPEPGWRPMPTHQRALDGGLQMYAAPCACERFSEYDGADEWDD